MAKNLKKGQRIGRTPKTGTERAISPRRVIVFKPSAILKQRINGHNPGGVAWVAAMFWIYWDTFWSLFFSAVWFMKIASGRWDHRQVAPMMSCEFPYRPQDDWAAKWTNGTRLDLRCTGLA
jgi:hypothetical protein